MYKFSKVTKVIKERGCMYFKNEHFKRGQIKELMKTNRNQKKSKTGKDGEDEEREEEPESVNVSINKGIQENTQLAQYRNYVKNSIAELVKILNSVGQAHPEEKSELADTLAKCNEILEIPNKPNLNHSFLRFDQQNKNMLSTMKLLPPIQPMMFSSQCSFMQIN